MFFVLLGFVNSLKPLQLARSGAVPETLGSLSTGAFRRTGRLVFPAALVTFLTWLVSQFGAFQLARRVDAFWLRSTAPKPSVSLVAAVEDLVRELAGTWLYGENSYDQPQWALLPLFRGSLLYFHDSACFNQYHASIPTMCRNIALCLELGDTRR